jgi:hypothetical protein
MKPLSRETAYVKEDDCGMRQPRTNDQGPATELLDARFLFRGPVTPQELRQILRER